MKLKLATLLILISGLFQAAFGQDIIVTPVAQKGYLLGPGDVITGKVLGEEEFNFVTTVDEDGKIQVPFFEQGILAKCRTEKELRADVVGILSKYLKSPQVSVQVTERKSRPPATIYGEVRSPKQVDLTRQARLLEILASAGGVTEKAGGMIQVFRPQVPICSDAAIEKDWKAESNNGLDIPSRLYSLGSLRQGNEQSNPVIFPGDIIVVQKAAPVYVVGEVIRPSEMVIPEGGLPLSQAVAMAGGITREAKTKTIKIHRRKEGSAQPEVLAVNYEQIQKGLQKDIFLEPFDIIEVDKAKKKFTDYLLDFAIGIPNRIPITPL